MPGRLPRVTEGVANKLWHGCRNTTRALSFRSSSSSLGIDNVMELPRITKITLNMGVGETITDKKVIEKAVQDMTRIAGQKPQITLARKSIATFKVREGYPVGCKVTLRRQRMWEFLDRLISVAVPRIRDFRGLNGRSFDGRGNYSMGIQEQIIFPEIDYDQIDMIRGMDITITTTAGNDARGRALLDAFNFPFRKSAQQADHKARYGQEIDGSPRCEARQAGAAVRQEASGAQGNYRQPQGATGRQAGRDGQAPVAAP